MFRELHLIEQWGTGVRRIFEEAIEQGLPEPKIEEVGMRVRFTVYLAKKHKITSTKSWVESPTQLPTQYVSYCRYEWILRNKIDLKE